MGLPKFKPIKTTVRTTSPAVLYYRCNATVKRPWRVLPPTYPNRLSFDLNRNLPPITTGIVHCFRRKFPIYDCAAATLLVPTFVFVVFGKTTLRNKNKVLKITIGFIRGYWNCRSRVYIENIFQSALSLNIYQIFDTCNNTSKTIVQSTRSKNRI